MNIFKILLILLIVTTTFSCESDDEMELSHKLVGEWLRSDFSDEQEFKLIFNANNVGIRTFKVGSAETGITSSAFQFTWSIEGNILIFNELDTVITTSFSFNSEGELILKEYSDLPFIKTTLN
jgi:hypothetical protein